MFVPYDASGTPGSANAENSETDGSRCFKSRERGELGTGDEAAEERRVLIYRQRVDAPVERLPAGQPLDITAACLRTYPNGRSVKAQRAPDRRRAGRQLRAPPAPRSAM